jgi:hypothetical protein
LNFFELGIEDEVHPMKSSVPMLVCGALGAACAVAPLFVFPTDGALVELSQPIVEQLPAMVFLAVTGFAVGGAIPFAWAGLVALLD